MIREKYNMHNGIPIWKHLKNNGTEHKTDMHGVDYGLLAEQIGIREIRHLIKDKGFLYYFFPDITILSINRRRERKYGDYCLEINYQQDKRYGKKILIVEIKHGKIEISQQQIKRYSNYLINSSTYFRKADEVKVIFMLFTEINTMVASASYSLCEFNKEFANKIIDAIPKMHETDINQNLFSTFEDAHVSIARV